MFDKKRVTILCFVVVLLISIAYAASDPKPVLYGQAFDGATPADGLTVTVYPQNNASYNVTDIVGETGNTGLSSYWKVNLANLQTDVQNNDVIVIHLTNGEEETQRTYVVNLDDGAVVINLNLDPAFQDYDNDGFFADVDCNDNNPAINPNAQEVVDGIDNDCDGLTDEGSNSFDDDNDGFSENDGDCNDNDNTVYPGALEICNGIDDDCDNQVDEGLLTTFYQDFDSDTYGNVNVFQSACVAPQGYVADNTDCDDNDNTVYPNAPELLDGKDNDCDGSKDEGSNAFDDDIDGFSEEEGDCNDNNPSLNPGQDELCDGIDNNCDGQIDEGVQTTFFQDADSDNYGNADAQQSACEQPQGYVLSNTDCDDGNAVINPVAEEICGDGIDQDCDGSDQQCTFTVEFPIFAGWTSFALPYKPSGIDNSEQLGQAIMSYTGLSCDVIMRFDGETQLMQDDVLGLADLAFPLVGIEGYFIHCDGAGTFTYQGTSWN